MLKLSALPALPDLARELSQADRALGHLSGALSMLPQGPAVLGMLRRQEAVASGGLDGVQASLLDLLDLESGLAPVGPVRDVSELRATSDTLASEVSGTPTEQLLANQVRLLGPGRSDSGWRRQQLWIGASGASLVEARHVPPPPDQLPSLIQEWEQFIGWGPDLHPLAKLSLSYAALEDLHPFEEANGRLLRIFLQQQLLSLGLIDAPVLAWSQQLRRERHAQLQAQHALRARGDAAPWMRFFLGAISHGALETASLAQRIVRLAESHRQQVRDGFGRVTPQALLLLDALLARPVIGIKDVIELTGTTFPAANELVRRFENAGLLVEITGNARNRRFRYAPFVRLFLDDE